MNLNLVRDKKTGKSKGYGFLAYEDQRSTILAVDNFNSIKVKLVDVIISFNLVELLLESILLFLNRSYLLLLDSS